MLHYPQQTRTRILRVADGCLYALALLLAYSLRANFPWFELPELEPVTDYFWMMPVVGVLAPIILSSQGFYRAPIPSPRLAVGFIVARSGVFTVMGSILLLFILREHLARSVIMLVGVIGSSFVYLRHEVTRWFDSRAFAVEQLRRRVLWVGRREENLSLRAALTRAEKAALDEVAEFDPITQPSDNFIALLHEHAVNVVILNLAGLDSAHASRVLLACAHEGVEVLVRPGLLALPSPRVTVDQFAGEAVFYYRAQGAPPSHLVAKQAFDYLAAALLLVVLSPLLLVLAIAIKLTSRGPILYCQTRAGLNGRAFVMFKFRSMRVDAEQEQNELAARNEMRGPVFKLSADPRVTRLGRFLRRHSLDELPQLWNVLRGEMSLVGPRPLPVEEVQRFDRDTHRRRLSVKPGLTCLWQVSGRSDISDFTDWVRLDLAYIDNWSLWLDLKILLATIPAALFGRGAR